MEPHKLGSDNYKRPHETKTDLMTKPEIKEQLINYEKVDDITKVNIGTRMKYFDIKTSTPKFRFGGILTNIHAPEYVVLAGKGNKTFSVQIATTIFFKETNVIALRKEYDNIILKIEEKYRETKKKLKTYEKSIEELKKENEKLKNYIRSRYTNTNK